MATSDIELWTDPAEMQDASLRDGAGLATSGPRTVVITGARGGLGKSVLAANFGIYLATIGRRTTVVDADPGGANVHVYLGLPSPLGGTPDLEPVALGAPRPEVRATDLVGLSYALTGHDEPLLGAPRVTPVREVLALARGADAEFVVLDMGASLKGARLDAWLDADARLFVSAPDPAAVENTYRFVRRAFARHLLRRTPKGADRRRMLHWLRTLGHTPAPTDLLRRLDAAGDALSDTVQAAVSAFVFPFALSRTRSKEDAELGEAMTTVIKRRLGLRADWLGYVEEDDAVPACARVKRPLLIESPGSKVGKQIEKLARRVMNDALGRMSVRPLRTAPHESHHDLLGIGRHASDEEVRRAYKRMKEVFRPDALAVYGLYDAAQLRVINARLDEAHDVLLDSARRTPYELSVFPPEDPNERLGTAPGTVLAPPPEPPLITPETDFTGGLLRAVRESQGIALAEIAKRTKVGTHHLEAIEREDFSAMPAPVYVRGFVAELAKYLKLDVTQVSRSYLRRYRQFIQEQASR